ncbi:MAG: epoxyqueuosine reductase [Acidobacteria bacterium]|nr:epoxyqueuosine reductase [Acidobacteriota bacterium]
MAGAAGRFTSVFAQTSKNGPPSEWIVEAIKEYTATSPRNSLMKTAGEKIWAAEKAWDEPLVGFASGGDALFNEYKDKVGPFHWTPAEIFNMVFPDTPAKPEELTVIAWILPAREMVKASLRKETQNPAEPWVRARMYGELFNEELRGYAADLLTKSGYPAVAPVLVKDYKMMQSEKYVFASTWSERHAAYAAGLGTFGLCDALITPKGKAMRCGAIVAKMPAAPTPRPYTDHHAYCLHFAKGACGACIARCAGKAITAAGHDKMACNKQLAVTTQYAKEHYDIDGYGCGFCQTGTPCESRIPV